MPGLARKLTIHASPDGLIIHPQNISKGLIRINDPQPKNPHSHTRSPSASALATAPVRIRYGDGAISTVARSSLAAGGVGDLAGLVREGEAFEAFGVVGLIRVFRHIYLVTITGREQVASIPYRGGTAPVYVITDVALTPCTSHEEARAAVSKTSAALRKAQQHQKGRLSSDSASSRSSKAASANNSSGDDESSPEGDDNENAIEGEVDDDDVVAGQGKQGGPSSSAAAPETGDPPSRRSSIAQDVIERRGSYGRFAKKWFSRSGWAIDQKRMMGLSSSATGNDSSDSLPSSIKKASIGGKTAGPSAGRNGTDMPDGSEAAVRLLPKLLRTSQMLFGSSRTFFFSYECDITRSVAAEVARTPPPSPLVPLHRLVDQTYFWNRHVLQPFIDAGLDSLALPLMQGFVGQRTFIVDSQPPQVDPDGGGGTGGGGGGGSKKGKVVVKESVELEDFGSRAASPTPPEPSMRPTERKFDITVISRRSTKRAGLRYLRRGIDEEGNVANCVETEQILSPAGVPWDGPNVKVHSFVQTRGSIPLFFTQSPYSLKPVPVMQHSEETNFSALKKHFEGLKRQYGSVQVVNLVEKQGVEAPIAEAYQRNIQRLNEEELQKDSDKVAFEWFDFHAVCRGMKFENVALLLESLRGKLEGFGSTVLAGGQLVSRQQGILRTNCMDCLDRTNVCQSSFAKHMLEVQLQEEGFDLTIQQDQQQVWFNTLWADNGDAISKQYASTGAMKGDYTRTRKRDYRGALTDAGLSLTRLFNGMFNDFFLQASIDFLLGNVTALVFEEFETTMMTKDPAVSMQNMRQQAIELCQKRVVADEKEEFIGGWTLLTPKTPDTVRCTNPDMEEAVLLLTDVALYLCRFDWSLDKVSSFERVDLAHVTKIQFGTYITSTIAPSHLDEMRNIGIVIEYRPGTTDITRVNTRSLSSNLGTGLESVEQAPAQSAFANFLSRRPQSTVPSPRKIALKALYSQTSVADPLAQDKADEPGAITRLSEVQQMLVIATEIERWAIMNQPREAGSNAAEPSLIERGDIVSVAEAKKNTGLFEQLGHSIKKLVWA